jgi:glycerol uptake facilitator protein
VIVAIIIVVGPLTNASLNPARALGPLFVQSIDGSHTHNWLKQLGAYVPANLIGASLAAFAYDALATPRRILQPIEDAVTEPDRADPAALTA